MAQCYIIKYLPAKSICALISTIAIRSMVIWHYIYDSYFMSKIYLWKFGRNYDIMAVSAKMFITLGPWCENALSRKTDFAVEQKEIKSEKLSAKNALPSINDLSRKSRYSDWYLNLSVWLACLSPTKEETTSTANWPQIKRTKWLEYH